MAVGLMLVGGLLGVLPVFADPTSSDFVVEILPSISVTVTDVIIESEDDLAVGESTVTIRSNNQTGFTATVSTNLDNTETGATSLNHAVTEDSIPTLTSDVAKASFPTNFWGFSLDNATYYGMPAKNGAPLLIAQTENPSGNGARTLYFGVKVGHDKAAGVYRNAMLVSVVTNYVPYVPTISYMQEMTPEICAEFPLEEQIQLIDNRDNKTYWVAKLADGKCWMTQNLDLNLSTGTALTNENTDLNSVSSWTPTRSTIDVTSNMTTTGTSSGTITGGGNSDNTPYSLDPGNVYFDGTYFSSSDCNYLTTNCEHFKNTKQTLNNEHGHVGNYYNWSAAVASNNTSSFTTENADYPDSICPKGWRLPHGDGSSNGNDFQALVTAYGNITDSDQTFLENPLFFVRAGYMSSVSLYYVAYGGYYWSSTVAWSDNARSSYFYSDGVRPSNNVNRGSGFSARCVVR